MLFVKIRSIVLSEFLEYVEQRGISATKLAGNNYLGGDNFFSSNELGPDDIAMLTILCGMTVVDGNIIRAKLQSALDAKGFLLAHSPKDNRKFIARSVDLLL